MSRGKLCKDCEAKRSGLYEYPLDALQLTQHSSPWAGCHSEAETPARAASQVRLGVRGLVPAKNGRNEFKKSKPFRFLLFKFVPVSSANVGYFGKWWPF